MKKDFNEKLKAGIILVVMITYFGAINYSALKYNLSSEIQTNEDDDNTNLAIDIESSKPIKNEKSLNIPAVTKEKADDKKNNNNKQIQAQAAKKNTTKPLIQSKKHSPNKSKKKVSKRYLKYKIE